MAASTSLRKHSPLKLPRLRLKAELLQAAPELASIISTAADVGRPASATTSQPANGQTQQFNSTSLANLGAARPDAKAARLFQDEERTEEDELREELAEVKAERAALMASIAGIRTDSSKAGRELQQDDIRLLRKDLVLKQQKLNELKQEISTAETDLQQLLLTAGDCAKLMPDGSPAEAARVTELEEHLKALEVEQAEAEAKRQLYTLLFERTKRDHGEMELRVRKAREMREAGLEDLAALTDAMHQERAAREDAERQLAADRAVVDGMRADWNRKLQERRKEVQDVERRQEEEKAKMEARRMEAAQAELLAKEKSNRQRAAIEAKEAQVAALQPKLQALEAQWAQLQVVSNATNADELLTFWQGLERRLETMNELVKVVEQRVADAKAEVHDLQLAHSHLCEIPDTAADLAAHRARHETAMSAAKARQRAAEEKLRKLRTVVSTAHQGIENMSSRLDQAPGDILAGRASVGPSLIVPSVDSLSRRSSRQAPVAVRGEGRNLTSVADIVADSLRLLEGIKERLGPLQSLEASWQAQSMSEEAEEEDDWMPELLGTAPDALRMLRRRTGAGPAWVSAASKHKPAFCHCIGAGSARLRMEFLQGTLLNGRGPTQDTVEPASSGDYSHLLEYWSSDDEDLGSGNASGADSGNEGDADLMVDRDFLKHRANKLVQKAKLAAAANSKAGGAQANGKPQKPAATPPKPAASGH